MSLEFLMCASLEFILSLIHVALMLFALLGIISSTTESTTGKKRSLTTNKQLTLFHNFM